MSSINKVILVGNLGADPEVRFLPNGTAVANLSIATSETWKDKNTGEKMERTEWHRVVMYARKAEVAGEYLKKGAKVYLEGKNQTRSWNDKENVTRYTTEVVCDVMKMLDKRSDNSVPQAPAQNVSDQPPLPNEPQNPTDFDDDIPF